MLVLSRKLGEAVILTTRDGTRIRIVIVESSITEHGNVKVRLGVDAPSEVKIFREEIQAKIDGEMQPHPAGENQP